VIGLVAILGGILANGQNIAFLVAHGANVNARMTKEPRDGNRNMMNRLGSTPFMMAAKTADVPLMRALLDSGADPALKANDGTSAIMVAAGVGVYGPGESPGTHEEALAEGLISLPAIVRPAFTMGGQGGGIGRTETELRQVVSEGLASSPINQVLVEESVIGWGEFELELMRDRNEGIESLREPHELEVLLDRERVELFSVKPPPRGQGDQSVDASLYTRVKVTAGPHKLGVAFLEKTSSLLETERQPLNVHFNFYRHPRLGPAVYQVSIIGPFESNGPGESPSRRRIFICQPAGPGDEDDCAKCIVSNLVRRAYRRPVDDEDLKAPLDLYRQGRAENGFEAGIELALSSVLVNPQFLFRIERDPPGVPRGTAYRIGGLELASRLSYFLWNSVPDEELLALAASGELSRPAVLEKQVRRMLADERSRSLVSNFAGQWLYLRNLESIIPDMRLFPDFDDNLRQALRQETELFFENILREDRSVLDLVKADYTYLNERLAKHYGIPHVYGSQFRRVTVDEVSHRGGLLRQGSVLTVTSYATRTSPVIRGKWILENILGAPPPPPPDNVPALKDNTVSSTLSVRERLAEHRANEACASCHNLMDPVGFSLDNFDAVGRWRETEAGKPIDAAGGLPDGSEFTGVAGLEQALLNRPELFVQTLTEKLLTFALGRGVEYYDAPAIRKIVHDARDDNYRFSRLILGIVESTPFQMRRSQ
jgi:hypothetical protein